jgi:hypothetical protein
MEQHDRRSVTPFQYSGRDAVELQASLDDGKTREKSLPGARGSLIRHVCVTLGHGILLFVFVCGVALPMSNVQRKARVVLR